MLVQTDLWPGLEGLGDDCSVTVLCQFCGKIIGRVSRDEMNHLLFGTDQEALCFECEDKPPRKWEWLAGVKLNGMLSLFSVSVPGNLPVNSVTCWATRSGSTIFQLWPGKGWVMWRDGLDGERLMWTYGVDPRRVGQIIKQLDMQPARVV